MTFYGNRLTLLRSLTGETMTEFGKKTGLSKQAISKIEQGKLTPSTVTAIGIASMFAVPLTYFTEDEITIKIIKNKVILT